MGQCAPPAYEVLHIPQSEEVGGEAWKRNVSFVVDWFVLFVPID